MELSTWVKVAGLAPLGVATLLPIIAGIVWSTRATGLLIVLPVVVVADALFLVAWWIIGVVILATNENNRCVSEGTGMAVMAIINLVIGSVRLGFVDAIKVFMDVFPM
jgi:hypothetical protein